MFTLFNLGILFLMLAIMAAFLALVALILMIILGINVFSVLSRRSAEKRELQEASAKNGVDPKEIARIREWFSESMSNGKFEVKDMDRLFGLKRPGYNYALIVRNESGIDFKEFSCTTKPYATLGDAPDSVTCTAYDWKNGKKGVLWFYCPAELVTSVDRKVRDIFFIPMDKSEKAGADRVQPKEHRKQTGKKYPPEEGILPKSVWRSLDGEYSVSIAENGPLLKERLGIERSSEGIEIHNESIDRVIPAIPGVEMDVVRVSADGSRLAYTITTDGGLWQNEISLLPDGVDHDTYKTNKVQLYDGDTKRFYYTIGKDERSQVILNYVRPNYDVYNVPNEFEEDGTVNIYVEENRTHEYKYYFLHYLGTVQSLSICGKPAATILSLVEKDMQFIRKSRYSADPYSESEIEECRNIFNRVKDKYGFTDNETAQYIYEHYFVEDDGSIHYKSRMAEEEDRYRSCYQEYSGLWIKEYNSI